MQRTCGPGGRLFARLGWFAGLGVCLAALAGRPCAASSIGVTRTTAAGVPVLVLTVDLDDPNVRVTGMVAQHGSGSAERFESMIHRSHPSIAVTGTFFSMSSLAPIGDIVVDGHIAHWGGMGTGFCVSGGNRCEFIQPPHRYARMDWGSYDFVCCAGPRLVCGGRAAVHPGAEGFHDRHLLGRAPRLAIGLTANDKLLFVATRARIQLSQLAKAMKRLGCVDAINLDAGSSLGVYKGGKVLIEPQRKLTNLILVYDDQQRYERFKARLTPGPVLSRK